MMYIAVHNKFIDSQDSQAIFYTAMQNGQTKRKPRTDASGGRGLFNRALDPIFGRLRRVALGEPASPAPVIPLTRGESLARRMAQKAVALALQGGGVHGAFTWGVLDRILEEGVLHIEAVSGTSAGALNATVLASGLAEGGRERARERLHELWEGIAAIGNLSPFRPGPLDSLTSSWNNDWTAGTFALEFLTKMLSPYQLNPFAINPLRQLIARLVDFERLRASPTKLFVSATNVRTGRPRIFTTGEMSADVVLASACLPSLNQAVEIEGEHYWDGGFTANPALLPIVAQCESNDIVIVQITPAREPEVPMTARDIQGRVSRIVFNAPLHRELETIAWMKETGIASGNGNGAFAQKLKHLRLHHINGSEVMRPLGTASALHAEWPMIAHLHEQGSARAAEWLSNDGARIGVESTAVMHEF